MLAFARASNPVFFFSIMDCNHYSSVCAVDCLNRDDAMGRRNERGNLFRPFDKTRTAGIKILVRANVVCLRFMPDPIKVKMIDTAVSTCFILIDNGKSRTAHCLGNPQCGTYRLNQGGFSCSHVSPEQPDAVFRSEH